MDYFWARNFCCAIIRSIKVMSDSIVTIVVVGIYTLLMPMIMRWLQKHVRRQWVIYLLLVVIGLLLVTVIGTVTSVLTYYFTTTK